MVGSEDLAESEKRVAGLMVAAGVDEVADLSVSATGEADETAGVGAKRLEGDQGWRLALGVGQVRGRDQAAEVGVALTVFGEQHQVVRVVGRRRALPRAERARAGLGPPAGPRRRPTATPPAPRRRRWA